MDKIEGLAKNLKTVGTDDKKWEEFEKALKDKDGAYFTGTKKNTLQRLIIDLQKVQRGSQYATKEWFHLHSIQTSDRSFQVYF